MPQGVGVRLPLLALPPTIIWLPNQPLNGSIGTVTDDLQPRPASGPPAPSASPIVRHGVTRRWSDAVIYGGVAYFVEVAADPSREAVDQFAQVLRQVDERLEQVGSDRTRLLQVLIYLPELADLAAFNALWDDWVPEGHAPSRACIHTALVAPQYRIELVITAALG